MTYTICYCCHITNFWIPISSYHRS